MDTSCTDPAVRMDNEQTDGIRPQRDAPDYAGRTRALAP